MGQLNETASRILRYQLQKTSPPPGGYVYRYFGALRFFLALLVVFQHYAFNLSSGYVASLASSLSTAEPAVAVFFAMSGFIISEACEYFYAGRPLAFIANRLIRIFIPFWIALSLMLLVLATSAFAGRDVVSYEGMLWSSSPFSTSSLMLNYLWIWPAGVWPFSEFSVEPDLLVVFWTIRFEVLFYFVVTFALILGQTRLARLARLLLALAWLITASTVLQLEAAEPWEGFHSGIAVFFCIGVLAYFAKRSWPRGSLPVLSMILLLGFAVPAYQAFRPENSAHDLGNEVALLVILLGTAALLIDARFPRFRAIDSALGDMSYSLYLTHLVLQTALLNLGVKPSESVFFAAFLGSIGFAYLFHRAVDPLISAVRDRIRGRKLEPSGAGIVPGGS